ncbi:hypothetical protein SSPO_053690 [Streptomyces antimycoticus]|uniref:Uncharacterized protein n=1 Tax=Streptomyces antimycoticus TaxID=68175 RepID=A0A499UZE2_9ACTN|nr:hypothetical protein SSPO_053690 [Streptomyces antimycoticus]
MREHRPLALGEERGDLRLDLLGVLLGGPLPAPHQPPEVGVHGQARHPEGIAEHHIGRLTADTGQGDQILEPARDLAAEAVTEGCGQAQQRFGLGAEEAGRPDQLLQGLRVGCRHVLGRRTGGEERGGGLVDPQIGGLGGQDRGHQKLERALEVQLGMGVRIHLGELAVDAPGTADEGEPGLGAGALRALDRFMRLRGFCRLSGLLFAHSGITRCGHPSGPLALCSHRRIGHPASLSPPTDIRPGHREEVPNRTPAAQLGRPVRQTCD